MSLNSYAYCQNNPLKYVDVNGHFVDTVIDLVSAGLSTVNMIQDPSVSNFIFLAWDIGAAALPFIPGSYVKKLGKLAGKVDDVVDLKNGKYLDDVIEGSVKSVSNMGEFFSDGFGKSIKNNMSKTKLQYDEQSIYKVASKTGNDYLKKGYGVYLDALHKDHLEVIDKAGKVKYVLNLDGILNADKTAKAIGRTIKGW